MSQRLWMWLGLCVIPCLTAQVVRIETPVDTDKDGKLDRLYAQISRPSGSQKVPAVYTISPYALGGNTTTNHNVDVSRLPQSAGAEDFNKHGFVVQQRKLIDEIDAQAISRGYANISVHSLGTGYSEGCPTIGDEAETLAAKAVIDWLNDRARGFNPNGQVVKATWSNGKVGMIGVSYNGTLPNMVATTGVEGLKAIVPVAAISNWYDYYRANGLVVGPGGYVGEDADRLAEYVVRRGACRDSIAQIATEMGRESGDFTPFWQQRDYVSKASQVKAAVFIMHGQADNNVRQRHAIQWWEALQGITTTRLWLHRGVHAYPSGIDVQSHVYSFFDRYVKGLSNGDDSRPAIVVQSPSGTWTRQTSWPHELTRLSRFYLQPDQRLASSAITESVIQRFTDQGRTKKIERLLAENRGGFLSYIAEPSSRDRILSGTTRVSLKLSLPQSDAANLTVALVEWDTQNQPRILTRGWVDPQNHRSREEGEALEPGTPVVVDFTLEPKQLILRKSSRFGVMVSSTDFDHTIRPPSGTLIDVHLGAESFVEVHIEE